MSSTHRQADLELEAIKDVVLKTYEAWNSRNTDNATQYFRRAPEDMYFDYWPLRFDSWETYKAGAQAYLNGLSSQGIKAKDIRVERVGNAAWASATYNVECTSTKGEKFRVEGGRYTGILVKVDGRWKVCHEHWSPPAPKLE